MLQFFSFFLPLFLFLFALNIIHFAYQLILDAPLLIFRVKLLGHLGHENNEIAVALKGVNEEVQEVIFKNLSSRLADMIREDMEFMGPVRLKDVEDAQQKIVSTIRRLEDSGEIVVARGGGDEVIV